jgi:hypothetical protein
MSDRERLANHDPNDADMQTSATRLREALQPVRYLGRFVRGPGDKRLTAEQIAVLEAERAEREARLQAEWDAEQASKRVVREGNGGFYVGDEPDADGTVLTVARDGVSVEGATSGVELDWDQFNALLERVGKKAMDL